MKLPLRLIAAGFVLSAVFCAVILFWPFILREVVAPISLGIWIFLRIFVFRIDQNVYWGAILCLAALFLCLRLLPSPRAVIPSEESGRSDAAVQAIRNWRSLLVLCGGDGRDGERIKLKKELAHLVLSDVATKRLIPPDFGLYDALRQGEIPLPERIREFLFAEEPGESGRSWNNLARSVGGAPRKWIRRWKGRETAERYRRVDEILCYLETSLEMKSDGEKIHSRKH